MLCNNRNTFNIWQEIINFRPIPDVAQMIESQKAKGVNISRWINNLLIGADKQADSLNLQIYINT